jgi:hypothetical protein
MKVEQHCKEVINFLAKQKQSLRESNSIKAKNNINATINGVLLATEMLLSKPIAVFVNTISTDQSYREGNYEN